MSRDILSGSSDDSLALRILDIVRRRAMLAACVFAVVLAAAVSLALYLPDLYRATTLVVVERPISEAAVRTPLAGELESRLYVIKQEILSRDRLIALIDRFNLYPELRARAGIEEVLSQARDDISVQPAGPEQVSGRTKTVSFTYKLENGAAYSAGAPRVFIEIGGTFYNTFDADPTDAGTNNGDGTFTKTWTIPANGRVGAAGIVYDNSSALGTVTVTNLTISGQLISFK